MDIQNQQPVMETPVAEKKAVHHWVAIAAIAAVAVAVFAVAWWMFSKDVTPIEPAMVPSAELSGTPQVLPASDSTADINAALDGIGTDTLDQEMQQIENDLNSL